MRIVYMLTSLGIGGAEKQAIQIAERMAIRGHEVAFIVLRSPQEKEWPARLPVISLNIGMSYSGAPRGLLQATRHLRALQPDLLHSHTFPANMMARTLRAIGTAPPVITTIHNIYEGGAHRDLAYRLTDRLSSHTTTVSRAIADRCIQIKAVPQNRCSVITNGIDTEEFSPSARSIESKKIRPEAEKFVWLAAGRDVPAKDFNNLLAAFQVVRREMPNAELWIAGQPSNHRQNTNDVRWLGVSTDMQATFAACDAFVLSSAWEGMPLVIGEAMSMETPVVTTDVGGVRELLGDSGVLVPSHNSAALAQGMLRITRMSEADRHMMGTAARARIVQHFDMNAKADEWEIFYTRILRERQ